MILKRSGSADASFGLGMAALGRPAYITLGHAGDLPEGRSVRAMEAQAHRVLDEAFRSGIRHVDAARSYGRAEQFLRNWLDSREVRPGEVVVGSKWGYRYTGDWQVDGRVQQVKDHSATMLRRQAKESMSLLGPHLRLYQIHSATPDSRVLEDEEVVSELRRLRERGLLLGVTASGPKQLETIRRAVAIRVDGAPLFSSVQATWNLLERSAAPALREAHEAGVAVLVKEALANGRLTSRGEEGATGPLAAVARRHGASPDAVALACVASQPWVDVVLLGPTTIEQLNSNLGARALRLSAADTSSLDELRADPDRYWSTRAQLAWQ